MKCFNMAMQATLVVDLRLVHTVRFFLIATAILIIAANGLYRTHWKCSHYATATTSPTPYVAHHKLKQITVAIRKKRTV